MKKSSTPASNARWRYEAVLCEVTITTLVWASAGFSQQNINVAQSTIKGFEIETRFDLPFGMRLDLIAKVTRVMARKLAQFDFQGWVGEELMFEGQMLGVSVNREG